MASEETVRNENNKMTTKQQRKGVFEKHPLKKGVEATTARSAINAIKSLVLGEPFRIKLTSRGNLIPMAARFVVVPWVHHKHNAGIGTGGDGCTA